ncbi:hypothetical protein [Dysgonomonas massiliensis]|uniref:hypothetical protein n=1 Tax=Dysgonomonas massiliensis TaxID=2040292 RepID=UPI000C77C1B2|nr:hypothetical protein [Dysgonomonas massiliensis]
MKKIALYLLLIIGLVSCKGEDGRDGVGANIVTRQIVIHQSDWRLQGEPFQLGSYYYATVAIPELTPYVMSQGIKLAYIEPADGVQVGIPYVVHKGEEFSGKELLWTSTYDCEYEVGYVTFIVTYSDFDTWKSPDTEYFNVLLTW